MAFEGLSQRLADTFKRLRGRGKLSENDIKVAMREVRLALLDADVSLPVAKNFINDVTQRAIGAEVMNSLTPAQQVIKIVSDELTALMGSDVSRIHINSKPPTVLMLCGLQGTGKTTHAAKLAKYFIKQGHRPLLVACDIYRPAAIDQLKMVGEAAGATVFEMGVTNPVEVAKAGYRYSRDYGNDIIILDTAGRLQIDGELMAELTNIKEAVNVDETLLVVDSMLGQQSVSVAKEFLEKVGLDGVILAKLDGDARGGAALSVKATTGKPIKFVGTGEKIDDLEPFYPERMSSRILGMGDVMSLIEKAQALDVEGSASVDNISKGNFDLNDMLDQLQNLKKMGGITSLISMIPGANKINPEDVDENQLKYVEAIIRSMTKKERQKPSIIDPKRKRRIAAGSGTDVPQVNRLLKQFFEMEKMMKRFSKNPKAMKNMARQMGMLN